METDYIILKEIKPELSGYIREAQSLLKKYDIPDEKVVHDIRVLLKKARAVLKLTGSQVVDEYTSKDIVSLRDAAKIMSSWRETTVHRKTLKELKKEFPGIFENLQEKGKLTELLKKQDPDSAPSAGVLSDIKQIGDLLEKTGYRIRFRNLTAIDPYMLLKELEKTYLKVVDVFLKCRNNPKAENLHEFRKRSKDFLYQVYFFRPLNNQIIKSLEKKLDNMTGDLGKINDLSQLIKALDYKYPDETNTAAMDELVVRIREKQDRYLENVWPAASRIFLPGKSLVNVLGYKILII